jgi:hypothetical protein
MTARCRHRYEISPEAAGSRVTYTLTQLAIANPMLRLALPGIRQLTWRMAIPMLAGRGLRNLLAPRRAARCADRGGSPVIQRRRRLDAHRGDVTSPVLI